MPQIDPIDFDDADGPTEIVRLDLPLDRRTLSWLATLSTTDNEAGAVIAAMLREIRRDDEAAHATRH